MPRTTAAQRLEESRREGWKQGYEAAQFKLGASNQQKELLDAKIKLINAVGQTMDVNARLLAGLMQVFDNGPR